MCITNSAGIDVVPKSDADGNLVDSPILAQDVSFSVSADGLIVLIGDAAGDDATRILIGEVPGQIDIGDVAGSINSTVLTVDDVNQVVRITNVPTSDPHIVNAIYSVSGTLHISSG